MDFIHMCANDCQVVHRRFFAAMPSGGASLIASHPGYRAVVPSRSRDGDSASVLDRWALAGWVGGPAQTRERPPKRLSWKIRRGSWTYLPAGGHLSFSS